jgi:hypothetical protein
MMVCAWGLRKAELRVDAQPVAGDTMGAPAPLRQVLVLSPRSGGQFELRLTPAELTELRWALFGCPGDPACALRAA